MIGAALANATAWPAVGNDMPTAMSPTVFSMSLPTTGHAVAFASAAPIIGAFACFYVGAITGGSRVAGRVGLGVLKVRPTQALSQQLASASVVGALAIAGAPVSMTQTIDGGLVGVGAALRASSVRWGIVRVMLGSWVLTLPMALFVAAALHFAVRALEIAP